MRFPRFHVPPSSKLRPIRPVRVWQASFALAASFLASCTTSGPPVRETMAAQTPAPAILPDFLEDPIEPLNRGVWGFNRGLLQGVIEPTGRIYQAVVPKPARTSIANFSRNVLYPGRVINEALQGRWQDAGDDSLRFLTNTTVGVAGFFDVATRWDIPKPRADFGQTFQHWGWRPDNYVMLPFFGPSDECNALGTVLDEATEPWNYVGAYRRISYGTTYNRITETSGETVRFIRSEADPYSVSKLAWSYMSRNDDPDWTVRGKRDIPTLQTLGVAAIRLKDPEFLKLGREMSVAIPATGKRLAFNCWLQKKTAPLVYISPGLGSHRLSMTTLSVAEALYQNGFSVVATTSVFHPEFMENASTAALPAHLPTDSHDLLSALTQMDAALERKHPGRFGARALVGCSMGAYQTLYLSAREKQQEPGLLRFDRYVGINPPVDLHYGIDCIDGFHDAPLAWPEIDRQKLVNNAVHKVGGLAALPPSALAAPPFDGIESKFLIGLTFRMTLRDIIFSSQSRHNLGVVSSPLSNWRREPAYNEILDFSYRDYASRFVFPYFKSKGIAVGDFKKHGNLRNFGTQLRSQRKARVITNRNDFLLSPGDIGWLRSTLGPSNVTVFADGGHLGNLSHANVQSAVTGYLGDLK